MRGFLSLLLLVAALPPARAQDAPPTARALLDASTAQVRGMPARLLELGELQRQADAARDARAQACVQDKRALARAMMDVSALAQRDLTEALATGNPARAAAEARKLDVAAAKVAALREAAQACLAGPTPGSTERSSSGDAQERGETSLALEAAPRFLDGIDEIGVMAHCSTCFE